MKRREMHKVIPASGKHHPGIFLSEGRSPSPLRTYLLSKRIQKGEGGKKEQVMHEAPSVEWRTGWLQRQRWPRKFFGEPWETTIDAYRRIAGPCGGKNDENDSAASQRWGGARNPTIGRCDFCASCCGYMKSPGKHTLSA